METLALAHLSHKIVASDIHERLLIRLKDVKFPDHLGIEGDIHCNLYVGPVSSVKVAHFRTQVEIHRGAAEAVLNIGALSTPGSWVLRVKFYRRPAAQLLKQDRIAEQIVSAPCPMQHVSLTVQNTAGEVTLGSANIEILRLVPGIARQPLASAICEALSDSRSDTNIVNELCAGANELISTGAGDLGGGSVAGSQLLETIARFGRCTEVESLLNAGIVANAAAVHAAASAGHPMVAHKILHRIAGCDKIYETKVKVERASAELWWSLQQRLPGLADWIHSCNPRAIDSLQRQDLAVTKAAYEARAWGILGDLVHQGQPLPAPACEILDCALAVGHVSLARACLPRLETIADMESALCSCLGYGKKHHERHFQRAPTRMVRETLEAHWRLRSNCLGDSLYEGPAILELQDIGESSLIEPEECPVCFEPLCKVGAAALLNDSGSRVCSHFICQGCVEHVQDEAQSRFIKKDTTCPLCRNAFSASIRLPDPTVDPCAFFHLACVPEPCSAHVESHPSSDGRRSAFCDLDCVSEATKLSDKAALSALCATLPVNPSSFKQLFDGILWPAWTSSDADCKLSEAQFVEPRGMLAWLSDHLLELKVEKELGTPPDLASNARAWFEHFDYNEDGFLTQCEILRGIAKTLDLSCLASLKTPKRSARADGAMKLRDLVESMWDASRWPEGVPLADFVRPDGFAQDILNLVPSTHRRQGRQGRRSGVGEALAKARSIDFGKRESYRTSRASPAIHKCLHLGDDINSVMHELDHMLQMITPNTNEEQDIPDEPHVQQIPSAENEPDSIEIDDAEFTEGPAYLRTLSRVMHFIDSANADVPNRMNSGSAALGGA